jgi:hypothetical protein
MLNPISTTVFIIALKASGQYLLCFGKARRPWFSWMPAL